ncbi:hypothetical protein MKZ38_004218 [Zalerion maritima]|uniref:Uncharacterized protein n=1 Tax=Zalerion maritima TaxID=339359 RepID=A0AAD5RT01_9PEZI|nr:hypothetical protein MKZ38_004218 [Zalerion maritima]
MEIYELTGKYQNRFMLPAVLLRMLDPVRGEPTAYSLDDMSDAAGSLKERVLKRKFLDSLALVCARHKNGDSVSAVTIEEGASKGAVIRVASNNGVSEDTLSRLRELVDHLTQVASCPYYSDLKESHILTRIIQMDSEKIEQYIQDLRKARDSWKGRTFDHVHGLPSEFPAWFAKIQTLCDTDSNTNQEDLVHHLRWAMKARETHWEHIKSIFSSTGQDPPKWCYAIVKLGRYSTAARALVKFASDFPVHFDPMRVEPVVAPRKTHFSCPENGQELKGLLRKLFGDRWNEFYHQLHSVWDKEPELAFQKACDLSLPVHAELQLVNFYDQKPKNIPKFRHIGVSKKSCYLCHRFLSAHPSQFTVFACHQKLYPQWRPPPTPKHAIYRQYRGIVSNMTNVMCDEAKVQLESRLSPGGGRIPLDSTAGISLSGLTDLVSLKGDILPASSGAGTGSTIHEEMELSSSHPTTASSYSPLPSNADGDHGDDLPVQDPEATYYSDESSKSNNVFETPPSSPPPRASTPTSSEVVLHIVRDGDSNKQDLVALTDIVDLASGTSLWGNLVAMLRGEPGDAFAVGFEEGKDYLVVNEKVRVRNERQFRTCLQHLKNSAMKNADVVVYRHG